MTSEWSPLRDIVDSVRTDVRSLTRQPRYLAYAVLVHAGFLGVLVLSLQWSTVIRPTLPSVNVIQAKLVDQAELQQQIDARKEAEAAAAARVREQKEAAARAEQERQDREAAAKAAAVRAETAAREAAAKAEQQRREKEAAAKAEQQRKEKEATAKAEQERKQKEAAAKAEQERKQKEAAAKAEQERRETAERAAREQTEIDRYVRVIQQQVARSWNRPDNWKKGQECTVRVSLIPGGDVVGVSMVRSCGDPLFDRSVDSAVRKASPLKVPPADNPLFDRFRELEFVFKPEL